MMTAFVIVLQLSGAGVYIRVGSLWLQCVWQSTIVQAASIGYGMYKEE